MTLKNWLVASVISYAVLHCPAEGQESKSVESSVEVDRIVLSASISSRHTAGATLGLTISVENKSSNEIAFISRGVYWDYELRVTGPDRKKVPLTRFGNRIYGESRGIVEQALYERIQPGKRLTSKLNVSRVFDLSEEGEYELQITFQVDNGKKDTVLKLSKIRFKLLPESP